MHRIIVSSFNTIIKIFMTKFLLNINFFVLYKKFNFSKKYFYKNKPNGNGLEC